MKAAAIIQAYYQNILREATVSASASVHASYDLNAVLYPRPDWRILFDTSTVTITWDLGGGGSPSVAQLGDILVIPVSNGATGSMTLTNDDGLSVALTEPGLFGRWPKTLIVDLKAAEPDTAKRTSARWHLVFSGNPSNVELGGGISIYAPKTYLIDRDFQWGYTERFTDQAVPTANVFGTVFTLDPDTMVRGIDLTALATDVDADALRDVFLGCSGKGRPGLLWFDPNINDGYYGTFDAPFARRRTFDDALEIVMPFTELNKGLPLQ